MDAVKVANMLLGLPKNCKTTIEVRAARDVFTNGVAYDMIVRGPSVLEQNTIADVALDASVHGGRIMIRELRDTQVQAVRKLVDTMRADVHLLTDWLREHAPDDEGKDNHAGVVEQGDEGAAPLPCPRDPDLRSGGWCWQGNERRSGVGRPGARPRLQRIGQADRTGLPRLQGAPAGRARGNRTGTAGGGSMKDDTTDTLIEGFQIGTLPRWVVERFLRNLEEAQEQPREWWCTICGVRWIGTRQDGPPCDCWKEMG